MESFKQKIYFNREKEDNWEISDIAEDKGFMGASDLCYLGYEVEMEVEIFENSSNKVLSINGVDISSLNISI